MNASVVIFKQNDMISFYSLRIIKQQFCSEVMGGSLLTTVMENCCFCGFGLSSLGILIGACL